MQSEMYLVGVVSILAHHTSTAETRGTHPSSLLVARHIANLVDILASGCLDLALVVALGDPV